MMYFFKILFSELGKIWYAKILGYYTNIDKIPIYNWNKIENGEYQYLFKKRIGKVPEYFKRVVSDMFYQFEKVNMTLIEKKLDLAYLRNLYATTGRSDFLNKARSKEAEIEKTLDRKIKKQSLNEQINYIEVTFNSINSIDVHKTSASRFYSLLNLAIEKVNNGNS